MVRFTTEQIKELTCSQSNIRNVSIIGQLNHGKTLLSNHLNKFGIVVNDKTDIDRLPIDQVEIYSTTTTTKLQHNTIYFGQDTTTSNNNNNSNKYYINLIDTPGHIELSSQVSAALRITDGSLFVVDSIGGFGFNNETILRQSLLEKHKQVLLINKIDQYFISTLSLPSSTSSSSLFEEIYSSFEKSIESFNLLVDCTNNNLDLGVSPTDGTVLFGSGLLGFAFTVEDFAILYSKKFGISAQILTKRLWGNNYFDPALKKFVNHSISTSTGTQLKRSFNEFVLEPIAKIISTVMEGDIEKLKQIVNSLNILVTDQQLQIKGLELARLIFSKFLPIEQSILKTIVNHIPSPLVAQNNSRINNLYQGPMDDSYSISILECNSSGPLVMYISALIPMVSLNSNGQSCYALGRVYSGTLKRDETVSFINKSNTISKRIKIILRINNSSVIMDSCKSGNIVCIEGLDQYISKSCIVSTSKDIQLWPIKYPTKSIFGKMVETKDPKDTPALIKGLKLLDKCDQVVNVVYEMTGEIIVYGAGQYHLDYLFQLLTEFIPSIEIKISSSPIVTYKESINQESIKCLAKSPNRHNKIYATANPLPIELSCEIESGIFDPHNSTPKEISDKLCNEYGWERVAAKNIWVFGVQELNTNILIDATNQSNIQEIKDYIIPAFHWVTKEGAICDESLWGVNFNINDVYLQQNSIVRGSKAFALPTTRRVLYASQLSASPTLLEPIYNTQINIHQSKSQEIVNLIQQSRGTIITEYSNNNETLNIIAQLPVIEDQYFSNQLKLLSVKAYHQNVFSHWLSIGIVGQNHFATNVALDIRKRKGLKSIIPLYTDYSDLE